MKCQEILNILADVFKCEAKPNPVAAHLGISSQTIREWEKKDDELTDKQIGTVVTCFVKMGKRVPAEIVQVLRSAK